uniref:Uncharacterized protein n=1 Tax=Cacopsylla melanoneura TaxID=428564 RepID=A0A8D8SEB4_9HEMI
MTLPLLHLQRKTFKTTSNKLTRTQNKVPRVKETIETHHPKVVKVLQTNRLLRTKTKTIHPLEPKHRPTKSEKAKSLVAKLPRVKHLHEIGRAKKSDSPRGKSSPRDERRSTHKEREDRKGTMNTSEASQEGKLKDQEEKLSNQESKTPGEDKKPEEKKTLTIQERPTNQVKDKVLPKHPTAELKKPAPDPEGVVKMKGKSPKHDTGEKSSAGKEKKDGGGGGGGGRGGDNRRGGDERRRTTDDDETLLDNGDRAESVCSSVDSGAGGPGSRPRRPRQRRRKNRSNPRSASQPPAQPLQGGGEGEAVVQNGTGGDHGESWGHSHSSHPSGQDNNAGWNTWIDNNGWGGGNGPQEDSRGPRGGGRNQRPPSSKPVRKGGPPSSGGALEKKDPPLVNGATA